MRSNSRQFGLTYLNADEAGRYLEKCSGHVLGVIGFGRKTSLPLTGCAPLWVDIPVLDGRDSSIEIWTSDVRVTTSEHRGISGSANGKVLFGSLSLEQYAGGTLEKLAFEAYTRIFEFIDHHDYRNLLRVWHYFPQINDDEDGLERYRGFNVGRHAAFVSAGRSIG